MVDPVLAEQLRALRVLDTFSDRIQLESFGEGNSRPDHVLARPARMQVADEFDIDLQLVDRQLLEVRKTAEAGSEVIEREARPQPGKVRGKNLG